MRIAYLCQYFPPESCAPAARAHELSREWVKSGHQATVLTGFPNHPEGRIHPGYRSQWRRVVASEKRDDISVLRSWLYPARNQGMWFRGANYLSFGLSCALSGTLRLRNHDIVIATSPQLLVGGAGFCVSRVRNYPFVFEVRDLWPESLVAVGQTTADSALYRLLEKFSRFLYERADHIVVDGQRKQEALVEIGIPRGKIDIIRNGVADKFCPAPDSDAALRSRHELRNRYGWTDRFVAMYCGTIGMAHGLETILSAAELLAGDSKTIFVILGEGADKETLLRRIKDRKLPNIAFLGKQPREDIPSFLAAADACLVPLKRSAIFQTAIPSKMFEAMGAGKPIVLAVEGEAHDILRQADAGIAVPPESPNDIARALTTLREVPQLCRELGANGRRAAVNNFTRSKQAAAYLAVLEGVIRQRARSGATRHLRASEDR